MMYVQFVNMDSSQLRLFLKNTPLSAFDAASIVSVIVDIFKNLDVDLKKMVMFISDSAAVMLGCNNGVYVKLKELNYPSLLKSIVLPTVKH